MSELYHALIHLLGLCGEPHPSLLTIIAAGIALPVRSLIKYFLDI